MIGPELASADLFDQVLTLPDPAAEEAFDALVGLDDQKALLVNEAGIRLAPEGLRKWTARFHPQGFNAESLIFGRPPLFLLGGDVGSGKTTLARGFANPVARKAGAVSLFSLSLAARGSGAVGEMTRLVTAAFSALRSHAEAGRSSKRKPAVMLIDEADSLAQSRAESQMHHEDRAGVNALIRGIDELAHRRLPVLVVMCTNRLGAIDPAVQRRAAAVLEVHRPTPSQAEELLRRTLQGTGFTAAQLSDIAVVLASPHGERPGCTHSDIVQRYAPSLVLDAFPTSAISPTRALQLAREFRPTPPFVESA